MPGCVARGSTVDEVGREIRDATEFHLEGLREDGSLIPPPSSAFRYVDVAGGKYCYGKTPLQTFFESATLAYDKQLDRIKPKSEPATAAV